MSLAALPWYIFDLSTYQLITSPTIPLGGIRDSKDIIIAETPIPGLNFQPVSTGGNGNRRISFQLPIVSRELLAGNVGLIKQFEALRNQSRGAMGVRPSVGQLARNPKVLYAWGVGSVPMQYYVTKCSFEHRADMVGRAGNPRYTLVDIELLLDETSVLYQIEEGWRSAMLMLGMTQGAIGTARRRIP